jgi:hypothetical protein
MTPVNTLLPGVTLPAGVRPPSLPAPPANSRGRCNDYLPGGSTLERFVWVARFYAANGAHPWLPLPRPRCMEQGGT